MAHRNIQQCGIGAIKGDKRNPDIVFGTHHSIYKWDAL